MTESIDDKIFEKWFDVIRARKEKSKRIMYGGHFDESGKYITVILNPNTKNKTYVNLLHFFETPSAYKEYLILTEEDTIHLQKNKNKKYTYISNTLKSDERGIVFGATQYKNKLMYTINKKKTNKNQLVLLNPFTRKHIVVIEEDSLIISPTEYNNKIIYANSTKQIILIDPNTKKKEEIIKENNEIIKLHKYKNNIIYSTLKKNFLYSNALKVLNVNTQEINIITKEEKPIYGMEIIGNNLFYVTNNQIKKYDFNKDEIELISKEKDTIFNFTSFHKKSIE